MPVGPSAQIMCQTKSPVRECQWSWRQLNQSQPWNLDVKSFPASGNDSTECSIKFKNVQPEQEGYWTCGARIDPNSSFTQSTPVRFLISEGIVLFVCSPVSSLSCLYISFLIRLRLASNAFTMTITQIQDMRNRYSDFCVICPYEVFSLSENISTSLSGALYAVSPVPRVAAARTIEKPPRAFVSLL